MLLVFIEENIFQISLKTEQIVTIYTIKPSFYILGLPEKKQKNFEIFFSHNYDSKTKKYDEIILLKDDHEKKIYPYYWDNKSLLVKKDFKLPKLLNLCEFNSTEYDQKTFNKKNNEKILIDEGKIIIFS